MDRRKEFTFTAAIKNHVVGRYYYTVVYLPEELATSLPLKENPRLRVEAMVDSVETSAALQPCKGVWYLMIPKKLMKKAQVVVGDLVTVRFHIGGQDAVEIPDDLMMAIESDLEIRTTWNSLSVGKRRGLAYRVSSAKKESTRLRRIEEVIEVLYEVIDRPRK